MKTARLSPLLVAVIGGVLSLLALGLILFLLIKPVQESITTEQARLDANAPGTDPEERAAGLAANKKSGLLAVSTAQRQVQLTKMQWAQVEASTMPPLDVSDREKAFRQLTFELTHYLGPDLQHFLLSTKGVTSPTVFALPAPPTSPNDPMIRSGVLQIPLGTVTVYGDFHHILTQFYSWQYFNRLVVVDGLSLEGNSPNMVGTYTATLYIFPQHDDLLKPPLAKAGGAGATAGGGSAPTFGASSSGGSYPGGSPGGGGYPGGSPGGGGYPGGGYPGGR